jgi:hypothetical protein
MKTSDKLLLGSVLFALLLFCLVHLSLYAKYSSGKFLTEKDQGMESLTAPGEPPPGVLFIKGNLHIEVSPCDTFSVSAEIRSGQKIDRRRSGDTLFLTGDTSRHFDIHSPWEVYFNMHRINVRCGELRTLIVADGMAVLKGQDKPGGRPVDLRINNGQVWVGEPYENTDPPSHVNFYDSLHIDETKANLTLQNSASIRALDCQLDDQSEIVDLHAVIDKPQIRYADRSRIYLTGGNFKKLTGSP